MSDAGEYLNYDSFASIYDRTRVIPSNKIREVVDMCARAARPAGVPRSGQPAVVRARASVLQDALRVRFRARDPRRR